MSKQIATGAPHEGTGLKNSLHGTVYQLVLLMWLIDHCVNNDDIKGFSLSTEDDRGEKFDDAVLTITNKEGNKTHHFIQAKHKQDDNATINESALLTSSKSNNDFQLSKYYDSFKAIRERLNDKKEKLGSVVLITNAKLSKDLEQLEVIQTSNPNTLLNFSEDTTTNNQHNIKIKESSNKKRKRLLKKMQKRTKRCI